MLLILPHQPSSGGLPLCQGSFWYKPSPGDPDPHGGWSGMAGLVVLGTPRQLGERVLEGKGEALPEWVLCTALQPFHAHTFLNCPFLPCCLQTDFYGPFAF